MRNFSTCTTNTVVSYNINHGEYISDDAEDAQKAFRFLTAALEVNHVNARDVLLRHREHILCAVSAEDALERAITSLDDYGRMTPSELEVLFEFAIFHLGVSREIGEAHQCGIASRSFQYCNLNTGKSLVWTLAVL